MASRTVTFYSDGYRLEGIVHLPDDYVPGQRRAAVLVCHGRLAIKEWVPPRWLPYFLEAGYVCLSFDYRNLGRSEGTLGRIIPQEEVRDVQHAVTFLQQQPEVDSDRIGILGWGLGGGVVTMAAAWDERLRAVVCASGIADGERYGRDDMLYRDWLSRQQEIAEDRVHRVLTGESKHVERTEFPSGGAWDAGRDNYGYQQSLIAAVGPERASDPSALGIPTSLTMESMEALYAFKPIDEVHRISPRPLLIIHAIDDLHFPYDHMVEMYERAGESTELIGIPDSDHLHWIDSQFPEQKVYVPKVVDWMTEHLDPTPIDPVSDESSRNEMEHA